MRWFYSILFYLALPVILIRLLWRSRKNSDYRKRWRERFGSVPLSIAKEPIWWHTVSVGETLTAVPLIKVFHAQFPRLKLLITTMTPTGAAQAQQQLGKIAQHLYLPYDAPIFVKLFLHKIQPKLLIIMETELWPNLLHYCARQSIPTILINARLSEQSYRGYQRFGFLTRAMFKNLTKVAAQSQADAERFIALGLAPDKITVTGSLKWDVAIPNVLFESAALLKNEWGNHRPVWLVASTHAGEEAIIKQAYEQVKLIIPDLLLLWAPRHPERATNILVQLANAKIVTRQSGVKPCSITDILLIDTLGELLLFYACADVVFVGGSLINLGGHNLLEPAALAKPIISGPFLFNFAEIADKLKSVDALQIVSNAQELSQQVVHLLHSPKDRLTMGQAAVDLVKRNRGATAKQLSMITKLLPTR